MTAQTRHTDEQLWAGCVDGDETAFGELFERHSRAVYNHAFRLTGSWTLAEEVTQATFVTAWRKRGSARIVDGTTLPWLLVVATNTVRAERRSVRRWYALLRRVPADTETAPDPADEVPARLDDERRMKRLLSLVRRLPRAEREAVSLCVWSGLPYSQAAAILGVGEGAVRSRVSRARARLARMIASQPEEDR